MKLCGPLTRVRRPITVIVNVLSGSLNKKNVLLSLDTLSYFSYQPTLHDWCKRGRGMCYPVCRMVHINEPLLIIGKSSPEGNRSCIHVYSRLGRKEMYYLSHFIYGYMASDIW